MRTLALSLLLSLFIPAAGAADLSTLYSDETLTERKTRYEPNIRWNFQNLVVGSLTPQERAQLGPVILALPLRGAGATRGHPMAFYAGGETVTVPIQSVKFFDDLTVAWAYFWANDLSLEPVTDYLGMLKYRNPQEIGGRFPPPFEALGVPADAWKQDPVVDDVSQKALKSALVWIMAHELGHIYYRHPGYVGVTAEEAQANEAEADRFANTIMRRVGVAPLGMVQFFMMMAHFDPNPVDFPNEAAWQAHLSEDATHPVTAARLQALADDLLQSPEDFAASEQDLAAGVERVRFAAEQVRGIAEFLADRDILQSIALKALATDVAALQRWKASTGNTTPAEAYDGYYEGTFVHNVFGGATEHLEGAMELRRQGNRVSGRFWFGLGEGRIEGIVQGERLFYEWAWGTDYGRGELVAEPQSGALAGPWGYGDSTEGGGTWEVLPQ